MRRPASQSATRSAGANCGDEKRGRELRQREERLGKLERRYEDRMEDCQDGDRRACAEARDIYAEMQLLIRSLPAEPEG